MNSKYPNILFVFADQWRRQSVGFMGREPVRTPEIDRFASQGVVLGQALSTSPLCSPSRSAMLTGRYPFTTGVTTNCKPGLDVALREEERTLGDWLKAHGYATGYIGKWHLDVPEQGEGGVPQSAARGWDAFTPPGPKRHGFDHWYAYNADDTHLAPHYWRDTPDMIRAGQWSPEHETEEALSFIEKWERSGCQRPFALFLSWNPPHQPFDQLPESLKTMYRDVHAPVPPNLVQGEEGEQAMGDLRLYWAAISGLDRQFGRLMKKLQTAGITDDTLVVLTSDHGELMGAHVPGEHKNVWYEEAIGVPCLFRWPGKLPAGGRSDVLFTGVDLAPAILALAGLPVPEAIEGTDLSPFLLDPAGGGGQPRPRAALLCGYPASVGDHREAVRRGVDINGYGWRALRTASHTYAVKRGLDDADYTRLLYDLERDPYQIAPWPATGFPPEQRRLASALEKELRERLAVLGDPFFQTGPE